MISISVFKREVQGCVGYAIDNYTITKSYFDLGHYISSLHSYVFKII